MSKRDYIVIAAMFFAMNNSAQKVDAIAKLGIYMKQTNPRFNPSKFVNACYNPKKRSNYSLEIINLLIGTIKAA